MTLSGASCAPSDTTPPAVDLRSPDDGAVYLLDEDVAADYSCSDEPGGSGLASCLGTVADGAAVDTSSVGEKAFRVDAADAAGTPAWRGASITWTTTSRVSSGPCETGRASTGGRPWAAASLLLRGSLASVNRRKIRVVVAKPGLDGHDRGAKIIARALRDAGMEVIYTGLHQTPEQIVETVLQEDADAVGLSILSGAHMTLVPRISELLKNEGAEDVVLVVGGTIPNDDIAELKELGVAEVFTPGAPVQGIIDFIRGAVPA